MNGKDSLGVDLSRVDGLWEVPFAVSSLLLEHPVRLLCEPHEPSAEVLHPSVRVVFGSVIVLPKSRHFRQSNCTTAPSSKKKKRGGGTAGGLGRTGKKLRMDEY